MSIEDNENKHLINKHGYLTVAGHIEYYLEYGRPSGVSENWKMICSFITTILVIAGMILFASFLGIWMSMVAHIYLPEWVVTTSYNFFPMCMFSMIWFLGTLATFIICTILKPYEIYAHRETFANLFFAGAMSWIGVLIICIAWVSVSTRDKRLAREKFENKIKGTK